MTEANTTTGSAWPLDEASYASSRVVAWAYLRSLGCSREEADDLAQEAVLALVRKQPVLDGLSGRDGWVRQAARYLFLTSVRTEARRARLLREHVEPEVRAREADAAWERVEGERGFVAAQEALEQCLEGLDERSREILDLHYRGGEGSASVGEKLGMREGAVNTALHRIRARLRDCMKARMEA